MRPLSQLPSNTVPVNEDLAEQALRGHGIPSQDPNSAAQIMLEQHEAERESRSTLAGGGVVAGLPTGAAIGVVVAGPVGVVVGATLGAVGALGGEAAGAAAAPGGSSSNATLLPGAILSKNQHSPPLSERQ